MVSSLHILIQILLIQKVFNYSLFVKAKADETTTNNQQRLTLLFHAIFERYDAV